MTNRTKFSLHEPTIKDLKATLIRTESKHRHSIESQNRLELESMTAKILFVGSSNVGKSSIINKFLFDFFPEAHNSGLEEHYKKVIRYKKRTIDLNLIDTGGLDDYSSLYPQKFSFGVSGYVFVYSVDDRESFEFIQRLHVKLKEINGRNLPSVLVANKSDLGGSRAVSVKEGKSLAGLWGVPYIEVSAKTHSSGVITQLFEVMLKEVLQDEKPRNPSKFVNKLDDEQILEQVGIFRFGNLVNLIVGTFYILFGSFDIIVQDFSKTGILLMLLIILGLMLVISAIIGFISFKSEEPEQIGIYIVLAGLSAVGQLGVFIYKLAGKKFLDPSPGAVGLAYSDLVVSSFFICNSLIQMYLIFLALNSKELLRRRREIRFKKYALLGKV